MDRNLPFDLVIILTLFASGFLILFWLYVVEKRTRVLPGECPRIEGTYAVLPNTSGQQLNICGEDETSPCIFTGGTLSDAIVICEANIDKCTAFTFLRSQIVDNIIFLNGSSGFSGSTAGDTYIRQTGTKDE